MILLKLASRKVLWLWRKSMYFISCALSEHLSRLYAQKWDKWQAEFSGNFSIQPIAVFANIPFRFEWFWCSFFYRHLNVTLFQEESHECQRQMKKRLHVDLFWGICFGFSCFTFCLVLGRRRMRPWWWRRWRGWWRRRWRRSRWPARRWSSSTTRRLCPAKPFFQMFTNFLVKIFLSGSTI